MSDDSFVREVDEAIRQDEFKRLWDRFGMFVLAGAVLIVAGVAGYKGWNYWQANRAAEAGARFVGALALEEDKKTQDAQAAFKELADGGPQGYRVLSRFQLASYDSKAGKRADAVKAYGELAEDGSVPPALQDYARIQAAVLLVDEASLAEMKRRVEDLAESDSTWRHSARELLGLAAYREGNEAEAERYFSAMLIDPGIPAGLRSRAEMMLALVTKSDVSATDK